MSKPNVFTASGLLAVFDALVSVKFAVLLLGLWLLLPDGAQVFGSLERWWLDYSRQWRPLPARVSPVTVVALSDYEFGKLERDPAWAGQSLALQLVLASKQPVAVIGLQPVITAPSSSEQLLRYWPPTPVPDSVLSGERDELLAAAERYRSWISSGRLTWVSAEPPIISAATTSNIALAYAGWLPWLDRWWLQALSPLPAALAEQHLPLATPLQTRIAWPSRGGFEPLTSLQLALQQQPNLPLRVSWRGQVLVDAGDRSVVVVSLSQLLSDGVPAGVLLLGLHDNPALYKTAQTVQALLSQHYYVEPFTYPLAVTLVLALLLVLLFWLYPRLPVLLSLVISASLVGLLLGAQQWLMMAHQQWFAVADSAVFIVLATFLMLGWQRRQQERQALVGDAWSSRLALASLQHQQGELAPAMQTLAAGPYDNERLQLTYDIAESYERQRQYRQAANAFAEVAANSRRFADAGQRAERLVALDQTTLPSSTSHVAQTALAQTLPIAQTQLAGAGAAKPVLGRYHIERELGRGAMGVVYLGTDPKIARQVAIKTLNYRAFDASQIDALKARFFREAEAAGRLNHPAIVTVYDVGEERDLAYIAMDYVDGQPASAYVHKNNLLAVADVYRLVAEVAEALHYAHQQGVVHRDIKPSNIIYRAQDKLAKVADFGIARIVDDSRTRTGDILGSPIYMSPEQLKGASVTGASDLYSLGVSFYQLLTGELPFNSDSLANLAYQIVNKKHKSVRDHRKALPASAVRIINKAMQKDPAKRFADGAAMAQAVRNSLARDFPRQ